MNKVALEAGTSPQIIFRCYRELVRPTEALEWFSITPATVEKAMQTKNATAQGSRDSLETRGV